MYIALTTTEVIKNALGLNESEFIAAEVDDDDELVSYLSQFKWYVHIGYTNGQKTCYARREGYGVKPVYMHREVLEFYYGPNFLDGMHVHHWDFEGLNNRTDNLHPCSPRRHQYLNTEGLKNGKNPIF